MPNLTRSYSVQRTGATTHETILTPDRVGRNLLTKKFSLHFDDDPRLEAQPLYCSGMRMNDGQIHDVVYVCTMANNVWAYDANDGKPIWPQPVNLGKPIRPAPKPHPGFPDATDIDLWGVNKLWGILSTPVIDLEDGTLYVVCWTNPDESLAKAIFQLHALDLTSGAQRPHSPVTIEASAPGQVGPGEKTPTFIPSRQKQRASLLLVKTAAAKTLFIACGMTHEEGDPTHGWVMAYDLPSLRASAAWCTTPHGTGCGIWQAGSGPAADAEGSIYVMTGNYGVQDAQGRTVAPKAGDLAESFVKLRYTPPGAAGAGKLDAVAWFTPFQDTVRNPKGQDNFQDYDLGSGGPVVIEDLGLLVGAGKDGVLYVLDKANIGQGSNFNQLKQPPIFFTYFPGFGIDPANVQNLDRLYTGKSHHLHGTPTYWKSPAHGPMLFVWGENECLRAWTIDANGKVNFLAKSAEVASAGSHGLGGMPGGFPILTSNGNTPGTGIVWATAPLTGDANRHVVEGVLRAYDAETLDPRKNADGTARLKLLWDSKQIPGNQFNHSKFCPPMIADGKIFVPTYDGRVDVYGLVQPPPGPLPTNADGF